MAIVCRQCGRRNPDGAQFCANPDCGAYLGWEGREQTGTVSGGPGGVPVTEAQSAAAAVTLSETTLGVEPGDTVSTTATVYNGGTQVEQFALTVLGPTAAWATVEPATLRIYPAGHAECTVRLAPPREAGTPAGRVWMIVRAGSTLHPGLFTDANATLDVAAFREVNAALVPQQTSGRGRTTHRVDITNAGNVVEPVRVEASDPTGKIRFGLPAGELPLQPGKHPVTVPVRPPTRWLGKPPQMPFSVTVTPRPPLPPIRLDGSREIIPLIAGWVPKVALALAGVAVAVAALMLVPGSPLRPSRADQAPPATAPPGQSAQPAPPVAATTGAVSTGAAATTKPADGGASASTTPAGAVPAPAQAVVVTAAGVIARRIGAVGVTVASAGEGEWEVTYNTDLRGCSYVAAIGDGADQPVTGSGLVLTARGRSNNAVRVRTVALNGTPVRLPFHLQTECANRGLWAAVDAGGRVARSSVLVRSSHLEPGTWDITFPTDMSDCGYVASIGDPRTSTVPAPGLVFTAQGQDGNPNSVHVETRALTGGNAGAAADLPFHLQAVCGAKNVQWLVTGKRGAQQRGTADLSTAGTGKWEVTFARDVTRCAYLATIGDAGTQSVSPPGLVVTALGRDRASVHVETRDLRGVATDLPLHLRAVC
jgi:hypothetical protein